MRARAILTVTQAAAKLGMSARYVRELCDRLGLGNKPNPRLWLLSEADLPKIAAAKKDKGRPKRIESQV